MVFVYKDSWDFAILTFAIGAILSLFYKNALKKIQNNGEELKTKAKVSEVILQ